MFHTLLTTLTICAFALLLANTRAYADTAPGQAPGSASLSGYISDAETGEVLVSATVQLKGTGIGATANKSGYYSLAGIEPGKHTVVVSYLGYQRQEIPVELKTNESRTLNVKLVPQVVKLDEVTVEGERIEDKKEITLSRVNIPVQQLQRLRIGGEFDVFRSIQYLPGVLSSSQISSGLYIRGGSPDQTLVLLDGSTVYNPTHLFGFFSTFNPDAVKDVDLIKGGFPAEYGGRMSAVLDLTQVDGNKNKFEGLVSLGLISTRVSAQGPVGDGSWFIGGRRTYIDVLTSLIETDESPLPEFFFYDLNAKISQNFGVNDKGFLSGFTSEDKLTIRDNAGFEGTLGISNRAVSSRWTHLFDNNLFSVFNLSWSRYRNSFSVYNGGFTSTLENIVQDITYKGNLEWFATEKLTFKTGIEANYYILEYKQNFSGKADTTVAEGTNEGGFLYLKPEDWTGSVYSQINYQLTEEFSMQAGLRGSYYDNRSLMKVDPRLAVRYQIRPDFTVKAAWGIYHQYWHLASVPDFSFFDTWLPTDSTVKPLQATHYVLGIETKPFWDVDFNIEGYYKTMRDIDELNDLTTQAEDVRDIFYSGHGEAYGLEFFLQRKSGRFTGWVGYSIGFINYQFPKVNQGRWFRPKWDRRHDFKVVAQYKLSEDWDVSATFTLQTGQSYTGMTSMIESRIPGEDIGRDVTFPADRYGLRLPPSHQLNLNANYHTTVFGYPAKLMIDLYNVYSRRDIWFRYYDTSGDVAEVKDFLLLPIIPTVALEVKF